MPGNLRVFIIDDDYISNIVTESILQRVGLSGVIHTYQNPKEALQFIQESYADGTRPEGRDLFFLDVLMPLMDGVEFLTELENIPVLSREHTAVVLLTGSEYPYHIKKFAQFSSIKAHLIKPLTEEAIAQLLQRLYPDLNGDGSGFAGLKD
ncbi:MAG: response regulator [Cytophagales bacterium]|nr:response regulator [Cytophagales bacterium]